MRSRGAPVGTSIIISIGHGIMLKCDRSSLEEFVQLNKKWAKSVLRRMGITKKRANSEAKILPGNFIEIKEQYLMGIKSVVTMEEILCELNWDQTAMKIVPSLQWTLEIVATDDKHQLTAVLTCSLAGSFLPIQLIYKGTTARCLLKNVSVSEDRHFTYYSYHWSNTAIMVEYVKRIIVPYIAQMRQELKLSGDHPALVLFDVFKGQCTDEIFKLLDILYVIVLLPNTTDRLQPVFSPGFSYLVVPPTLLNK